MRKSALLSIFSFLSIFNLAQAADEVRIGTPESRGQGCPANSASAVLSSDKRTIQFLLPPFQVRAGSINGASFQRKNCSLLVPIYPPPGYKIAFTPLTFRGSMSLSKNASSALDLSYFFPGQLPEAYYSQEFTTEQKQDFFVTLPTGLKSIQWSECGRDTHLRINAAIRVMADSPEAQAIATLDNINDFQIHLERCQR